MRTHVVVVNLQVATNAVDRFMVLLGANAETSLALEPGCRRFDVCVDPADAGALLLYELYDDAAAFQAHLASDHYKSFDDQTKAMIVRKTVRQLELIEPQTLK